MARKAQEAKAPENHERWIVSYADMVTLLWALFVVLYALSDSNPRKLLIVQKSIDQAFDIGVLSGSAGPPSVIDSGGGLTPGINEIQSKNLTDISKTLGEFAKARGIEGKIQIRQDAESITISLADNLLFGSASADLKPGSQDVLLAVAEVLNELPNQLQIEGHTDNVPVNNADFATNWELSSARATTVLRFLVDEGHVSQKRIHGAYFADTRPLASNETAEGRALNRRADIVIIYPTQEELERALSNPEKK
jgi:chemotaxis protein MotB